MSSGWRAAAHEAKAKHRTDIEADEWAQEGWADTDICERLAALGDDNGVPRVHCCALSQADFVAQYEEPNLPVMIDGIPTHEGWNVDERWTMPQLLERLGDRKFKVGEDDDGNTLRLKLSHFAKYQRKQRDDSPLYVFEGAFDNRARELLDDYRVPSYFSDDLFRLVGESRRPPYRWFLLGPKRSGTTVHVDPLGTSAWNALIAGTKRWVLFPPDTSKRLVKAKELFLPGRDDEAINYFAEVLPQLRQRSDLVMYEFLQHPGETVFVPGGWWHAVMNLTDTVAVTQNFCSRTNFARVWKKTRSGRKRMAQKWLRVLEPEFPQLVRQAAALDAEDGFVPPPPRSRSGSAAGSSAAGSSAAGSDSEKKKSKKKRKKHASSDAGATAAAAAAAAAPSPVPAPPPPAAVPPQKEPKQHKHKHKKHRSSSSA